MYACSLYEFARRRAAARWPGDLDDAQPGESCRGGTAFGCRKSQPPGNRPTHRGQPRHGGGHRLGHPAEEAPAADGTAAVRHPHARRPLPGMRPTRASALLGLCGRGPQASEGLSSVRRATDRLGRGGRNHVGARPSARTPAALSPSPATNAPPFASLGRVGPRTRRRPVGRCAFMRLLSSCGALGEFSRPFREDLR